MNDKGQKLLAGTCQDLVWKIEGKIAKFSTTTFTCRSSFYLFYGMGAQKT
jgi:hypothetical protein